MLKAGTATIDITPSAGSRMAAFPRGPERTPRRAKGAHDPLSARILVLSDGSQIVAFCTRDTTTVRSRELNRIRELAGERLPELNGPRLTVACSHTHSGPETSYLFGGSPDDPWIVELDRRIAAAVFEAHARIEPVTLSTARTSIDLSHNRRVLDAEGRSKMVHEYEEGVTTGPVDPDLTVLRVDRAGRDSPPLAVFYHYTAHALTAGPANDYYTADYPGVARHIVEQAYPGSTALFWNGAAGNVHPRFCMRDDYAAMEEVGTRLGRQVLETADAASRIDADRIVFETETRRFPNRVDPSLEVSVELSCLRLGELIVAFVPGEVFVEFQLEFKRRVAPQMAIFVGYANGWPGYVPTRSAYAEGGYGVDLNTSDPPEYSRTALPEGAGETILDTLVEVAGRTVV